MNWESHNIGHQHIILKIKVPLKDFKIFDLKNMIKSYCFDTQKDWDKGIHLLLFAVMEYVQESLGFSPFELVFGHTVRGPLKLLKEKFLSQENTPFNLLQMYLIFEASY